MDAIWTQFSVVLCCLILHSGLSFAAFANVAIKKPSSTSSTIIDRASFAVDGNTVGHPYGQCVDTGSNKPNTWWEVDLGKPYYIHEVKIYFRTDYTPRRNGVKVYISSTKTQLKNGHLCGTVTGKPDGSDIAHIISIICDFTARYVILYLETNNNNAGTTMDFCEVEIYACDLDINYGSNCENACNARHCATASSCRDLTGDCGTGGCQGGWSGLDCTRECAMNVTYGANCNKRCESRHCASSSPSCDVETGDCGIDKCRPGWMEDDCTQSCESNVKYGSNCEKFCDRRQCAVNTSLCRTDYGTCDGGCQPGWTSDDCTLECESNVKYGSNCEKFCDRRQCAVNTSLCRTDYGTCDGGCQPGWMSDDCTLECQGGLAYGSNCEKRCADRHCLSDSTCVSNTGICIGGCKPGWIEDDCSKVCVNGSYGPDCSLFCSERHCKHDTSSCNPTNGKCETGCQTGWKDVDCTECDGTYGVNCSLQCSKRQCKNDNSPCDNRTGECNGGCKPGWMNLTCTQPCIEGRYGEGCEKSCLERHCHGKDECAADTGQCVDGCAAGWEGLVCISRTAAQSSSIGTIVGPVVGVIVIVILAVIVGVVLIRRRRMAKHESTHTKTGTGDDTKTRSKPDTKHSNDKKIKRKIRAPKRQTDDADVYVNVGPRAIPDGTEFPEVDESAVKMDIDSAVEEMDEDEDVDEPGSVYYNITDYNLLEGSVAVGELARSIEQIRSQTGGFEKEYKKLQSGFSSSYDESQIPKNRPKNRFAGYYPYDNNRVTLTMLPDVPHSDYINASYLDAHAEKNYFIAAQAPNGLTVPDFWRMMWEKNCGHIIMLTKLVEATKNKCDPYWSDTEVMNIGQYKIALAKKEERSDFVFRKLKVTHRKSGQSKTFQQFHYMTWPDHGVPNVHDFLQFVWTVRNTKPTLPGPVLVHCSAGIGRTGTYIALDILLDEMEDTGCVDIMKVVTQMRDQRKGVVQTKEQYEMIFVGMLELAHLGNTTLSSLDFQQKYAKQKGSMSMGKKTVDQLAQEVVRLNDTPYEGDANKYKVWASGRQDMIAMSPPSRLSKNGYLLVSVPKGAEENFWKLMIDNDSDTVITLSSKTEVDLIPRPSTSKTHGKITVTALHEASVIHEITEKVLQVVTKEHGEKREIQHYCVHGWSPTIDSATLISCLTTMTEKIQEQQEKVRLHPVTVVYRESEAKHAITLCITNNIMTGIKLDKEVEVFNNVRRFQSVLPKIKLTKEDFAFFCNVAFLNLEASTLYANCPSTST